MTEKRIDFDEVLEDAEAIKATESGDLIVEGYFATYDLDRQNERFLPGSFGDAAKAFMEDASRPLLYQHNRDIGQLGQVEHLEERAKGLWGRARIPRPADGSPLRDIYDKIKRGMTRGVSIRTNMLMKKLRDGTAALLPTDIQEFSMTPTPVNTGGVVAVASKAFGAEVEEPGLLEGIRDYFTERFDTMEALFADLDAGIAEKAEGSASQREKWAQQGVAMKDGSFPITHCGNDAFSNGAARKRAHQGGASESAIMAHIRKREEALGCKSGRR